MYSEDLTAARIRPHRFTRRLRLAVGVLIVVAVAVTGCSSDNAGREDTAEQKSVWGLVVKVEAPSLTVLEYVDVQDDTGFVWRFQPGSSYRGFTPSHLREHMVQGLPVLVVYHQQDGDLVIDDITD